MLETCNNDVNQDFVPEVFKFENIPCFKKGIMQFIKYTSKCLQLQILYSLERAQDSPKYKDVSCLDPTIFKPTKYMKKLAKSIADIVSIKSKSNRKSLSCIYATSKGVNEKNFDTKVTINANSRINQIKSIFLKDISNFLLIRLRLFSYPIKDQENFLVIEESSTGNRYSFKFNQEEVRKLVSAFVNYISELVKVKNDYYERIKTGVFDSLANSKTCKFNPEEYCKFHINRIKEKYSEYTAAEWTIIEGETRSELENKKYSKAIADVKKAREMYKRVLTLTTPNIINVIDTCEFQQIPEFAAFVKKDIQTRFLGEEEDLEKEEEGINSPNEEKKEEKVDEKKEIKVDEKKEEKVEEKKDDKKDVKKEEKVEEKKDDKKDVKIDEMKDDKKEDKKEDNKNEKKDDKKEDKDKKKDDKIISDEEKEKKKNEERLSLEFLPTELINMTNSCLDNLTKVCKNDEVFFEDFRKNSNKKYVLPESCQTNNLELSLKDVNYVKKCFEFVISNFMYFNGFSINYDAIDKTSLLLNEQLPARRNLLETVNVTFMTEEEEKIDQANKAISPVESLINDDDVIVDNSSPSKLADVNEVSKEIEEAIEAIPDLSTGRITLSLITIIVALVLF